jgi:hypothetical protein
VQTRLKSWESPRRQGRNNKGKGGAARSRQLKKRQQMLRQKLKQNGEENDHSSFFIGALYLLYLIDISQDNIYLLIASIFAEKSYSQ